APRAARRGGSLVAWSCSCRRRCWTAGVLASSVCAGRDEGKQRTSSPGLIRRGTTRVPRGDDAKRREGHMRTPPAADQPPRLAGYAATAEAAWMGAPQATEFLEPLRLPRLRLPRLLNREFGVAGATALLMASFFFSALLGAVRQILFNRQFGAGADASAYYAAFRLPDTLFSLVAGGA